MMGNKVKTWVPPTIPYRADLSVWKALCNDIHDQIIDAGLVQTEDTGQLDINGVGSLPSDGTFAGYRIYEINDGLSETHPIYIKLEFGCGVEGLFTTSANNSRTQTLRIRVSYGVATDGMGALTGPASVSFGYPQSLNGGYGTIGTPTHAGISYYCRSETKGFFGLVYGAGSRNKPTPNGYNHGSYYGASLVILIQRDGVDGFAVHGENLVSVSSANYWGSQSVPAGRGQYVPFTGSTAPAYNTLAIRVASSFEPASGDIICQPVFYTAPSGIKQWPSLATYNNIVIQAGAEFTLEAEAGDPRNFIALGNEISMGVDPVVGSACAFAMLFDDD